MIQNKINNVVFIAIFLLHNKMLRSHKKLKMVLEIKFQDKTKSKRCDCAKENDRRKALQGKGHLFSNIFNVILAFSKRLASEASPLF